MPEIPFLLSDPGEGLTEAEIISWKVEPGQEVKVHQVLVEVETAKSLVELPSPHAGRIISLLVEPGQVVEVGSPLLLIEVAEAADSTPAKPPTELSTLLAESSSEENTPPANLVGYGSTDKVKSRRHPAEVPPAGASPAGTSPAGTQPGGNRLQGPRPLCAPPVRKLARELGVDLGAVVGTGPGGVITRADLLACSTRSALPTASNNTLDSSSPPPPPPPPPAVLSGERYGGWSHQREERLPVRSIRKATAKAMCASAFTAPHVSVFVETDVTRTVELVARLKRDPEFTDARVSPLLLLCRALIWAVRRQPQVTAVWEGEEILVRNYVNLGIACATPRGLVVPNVKDAHELSLLELARALDRLVARARAGKITPADTSGGTVSVTNIGVFGVDAGTPILNPGESSIVVMGAIRDKPWVVDGEVRSRKVSTIGGSFDHRVMDGDIASRFIADIAAVLEEPGLLVE